MMMITLPRAVGCKICSLAEITVEVQFGGEVGPGNPYPPLSISRLHVMIAYRYSSFSVLLRQNSGVQRFHLPK